MNNSRSRFRNYIKPMREVARKAWDLYDKSKHLSCVVTPSIPITFFGDSIA